MSTACQDFYQEVFFPTLLCYMDKPSPHPPFIGPDHAKQHAGTLHVLLSLYSISVSSVVYLKLHR